MLIYKLMNEDIKVNKMRINNKIKVVYNKYLFS
jgi:hypothetical protein